MKHRNILTGETTLPTQLNGRQNVTWENSQEELVAAGWRIEPGAPELATNMTRISKTFIEGDGVTGAWEVVDRLTSEIDAEAAAAQAQAEIDRQAAKSDALKHTETEYLTICQQLTGSRAKLGVSELEAIITGLMATDPNTAVALTLRLLTIDAAGKREGGLQWWDDIHDHAEVTP